MSSITEVEKRYFERLLDMSTGYVLDFTNATFAEFFQKHNVAIFNHQYERYGTSKAKRLRSFWERESDVLVGKILSGLLDVYEVICDLEEHQKNNNLLNKCRRVVARLSGTLPATTVVTQSFLEKDYTIPDAHALPIDANVASIIDNRLHEIPVVLKAGGYLSAILLCGSVLEAVLLGAALQDPGRFGRSQASPKNKGKVKPLHEWSLAQLVDVACEINILEPDIKKFSHGLRDFRNYIHPYQELVSDFTPDIHTARVCYQVLKAALASVAGMRRVKPTI